MASKKFALKINFYKILYFSITGFKFSQNMPVFKCIMFSNCHFKHILRFKFSFIDKYDSIYFSLKAKKLTFQ